VGCEKEKCVGESEVSYPNGTPHSHVTPKTEFPSPLIVLRRHKHSLEENIILNDELGKHFHVIRKIIMGVSQGRDTDIYEKGLAST
jgi:hypothetical protein